MIRTINGFILAHGVFALAMMSILAWVAGFSAVTVALNVLLVVAIYSFVSIGLQTIVPLQRKLKVLILSVLTFLLVVTYVVNIVANHFWHNNVSFMFIYSYASDLKGMLADVSGGYTLIIIFLIVLFTLIVLAYRSSLFAVIKWESRPTKGEVFLPLCISGILALYLFFGFSHDDPGLWQGEPITSLSLDNAGLNYVSFERQLVDVNSTQGEIAKASESDYPTIVFMHLDAIRADHMSVYGYERETTPLLSEWVAKHGAVIKNNLSICSESVCGLVSAMSGQRERDLTDRSFVHNYLKENADYTNYFFLTGSFDYGRIDAVLKQDVDFLSRADREPSYNIHDDNIILDGIQQIPVYSGDPNFFLFRYMSSHPMGRHFERFKEYKPNKKNLLSLMFPSLEGEIANNAADNNILQMDHFINESLDLLAAKGYLQNFIVVIYGDHGDALGEHGYYGHYRGLYQEEVRTPLVILSSYDLSNIDTEYSTLNDIVPTVLELAGLKPAIEYEGISLLRQHDNRWTYHYSKTGVYANVWRRAGKLYKYIWFDDSYKKEAELYELHSDPQEMINLVSREQVVVESMQAKLFAYFELNN